MASVFASCYSDVQSEADSERSEKKGHSSLHLSAILGLLKFFSVNRDRPGVFVSTYLLLSGWKESR